MDQLSAFSFVLFVPVQEIDNLAAFLFQNKQKLNGILQMDLKNMIRRKIISIDT